MPCLWFDGDAEAAVDHYLSIFPNSRRVSDSKYGPETPGEEGSTMTVSFELDGNPFMALNGGPSFHFTPAVSFAVNCATQDEVDHYWDRLLEGGEAMQCGWLTDRFGVSWQIVPSIVAKTMQNGDIASIERVMQAVMPMKKLDIATLQRAYEGK